MEWWIRLLEYNPTTYNTNTKLLLRLRSYEPMKRIPNYLRNFESNSNSFIESPAASNSWRHKNTKNILLRYLKIEVYFENEDYCFRAGRLLHWNRATGRNMRKHLFSLKVVPYVERCSVAEIRTNPNTDLVPEKLMFEHQIPHVFSKFNR